MSDHDDARKVAEEIGAVAVACVRRDITEYRERIEWAVMPILLAFAKRVRDQGAQLLAETIREVEDLRRRGLEAVSDYELAAHDVYKLRAQLSEAQQRVEELEGKLDAIYEAHMSGLRFTIGELIESTRAALSETGETE